MTIKSKFQWWIGEKYDSCQRSIKKQWFEFCKYVKEFAIRDSDTNDEEYNYGRYEIMNATKINFFDPAVEYYCMCNNLNLRDIPGGIDTIFG